LPHPPAKQEACLGGELFDMVIERKYFTEADAASITAAILSVMQHCHSKGIIYRGELAGRRAGQAGRQAGGQGRAGRQAGRQAGVAVAHVRASQPQCAAAFCSLAKSPLLPPPPCQT
jgi:hypothetical protein